MPKNMKKWTDEEVALLRKEWPDKSGRKELSEKLGRSIPALRVKYENVEAPKAGKPKKPNRGKNKGAKITPAFATSEVNSSVAISEAAQQPREKDVKTVRGNEIGRLQELMDAYFKEKQNGAMAGAIADTGSLMLEGAMIKGMRQMLLMHQRAGYFSAADLEKLLRVVAKYEKKLMWDALKEHFVSGQDED